MSELAFVLPAVLSLHRLKPNRPQPLESRPPPQTLLMSFITRNAIQCPPAKVCKLPDAVSSSNLLPECQQSHLRYSQGAGRERGGRGAYVQRGFIGMGPGRRLPCKGGAAERRAAIFCKKK